jgi:hypothetical protein
LDDGEPIVKPTSKGRFYVLKEEVVNMPSNPFRRAYIRIAEYVTKFYLELQRNYASKFKDETSLLATAGFITAEEYLPISKIVPLARDALSNKEAANLFQFIMDLEIEMEIAHRPQTDRQQIRFFLLMRGDGIMKAIEETRKKYKGDKRIAYAIDTFMQSAEFKSVRETLNIKE